MSLRVHARGLAERVSHGRLGYALAPELLYLQLHTQSMLFRLRAGASHKKQTKLLGTVISSGRHSVAGWSSSRPNFGVRRCGSTDNIMITSDMRRFLEGFAVFLDGVTGSTRDSS